MKKQYGMFTNNKGEYRLTNIPAAGNFEYIYKNKKMFLRVDQFGPSFIQYLPPAGMDVIKRKERELLSPLLTYVQVGKTVYSNFDLYKSQSFEIIYQPEKCIYHLKFKVIDIITTIFVDKDNPEINISVSIINKTNKDISIKVLEIATLEITDSTMAVWDKREWYEKTTFDGELNNPMFVINHFSVNANKNDRKNVSILFDNNFNSVETSYERLVYQTKNFTALPNRLNITNKNEIYAIEQTAAVMNSFTLKNKLEFNSLIRVYDNDENINKKEIYSHFAGDFKEKQLKFIKNDYVKMISVQSIETNDINFNKFVNEFLPQEMSWVVSLDRGWPTGMRGTRDCANDFMGCISYNPKMCRDVIIRLFSSQRITDGWFPRQIPFGDDKKYDLREFVDSGAFVIEFIYEYLSYTNDFSILEESYPYYENNTLEKGLIHLIKAATFYTLEENIGEHGLIKLKGGDWLDCLNRVGLKGKAETLMVTCQAILSFKQVNEILEQYKNEYKETIDKFNQYSSLFKKNINKHCLNEEGFYQSIFADDGRWYFSLKDIDGHKRVYVPSNAYAIIAGVNNKKNRSIIKAIKENNKTDRGYRLFSVPFGNPPFEGLGKMSTGDFPINSLENGAIYNHGSQLFLIRALAEAGDYKTLYEVLNYALPYNQKYHPEVETCLPMYAITNAYNLIPGFTGRAAMCFLTGSIAMIERAIYHWMFGINFHINYLEIKPCIPREYKDSDVRFTYNNYEINIHYNGYGNKVNKILLNNKELLTNQIDKKLINNILHIEVLLNK